MTARIRRRCGAGALGCALWAGAALGADARRVRLASEDQVVEITAAVRHTTVIALPAGERILDFVAGDTEFWQVAGEANLAYVKPTSEAVRTNLALVTEGGRIYAFLCREGGGEPDLVVHVEVGEAEDGPARDVGTPIHQPRFVAAGDVAAYREAAREAADEAAEAHRQAAEAIAGQVEAFRASYPSSMRFEYRLEPAALRDPFQVVAMWHDGRHTYLRSRAPESPALYESRDGKPSLVEYELSEDGLYVTQRVLRDGWLQAGKQRARWTRIPGGDAP